MNWMIILNKEILKYKIGQISKTNEVVRNILLLEHVVSLSMPKALKLSKDDK